MESMSPPNINQKILSIKHCNLTVGQYPPDMEEYGFRAFFYGKTVQEQSLYYFANQWTLTKLSRLQLHHQNRKCSFKDITKKGHNSETSPIIKPLPFITSINSASSSTSLSCDSQTSGVNMLLNYSTKIFN
jgi:hypothetical protein